MDELKSYNRNYQYDGSVADNKPFSKFHVDDVITVIDTSQANSEPALDSGNQLSMIILDSQLRILRTNVSLDLLGVDDADSITGLHVSDIIDPMVIRDMKSEFAHNRLDLDGHSILEWQAESSKTGKLLRFTFFPSLDVENTFGINEQYIYILIIDEVIDCLEKETNSETTDFDAGNISPVHTSISTVNLMPSIELKHIQQDSPPDRKPGSSSNVSSMMTNAQESERKRLACELHDGVGQVLSATKYRIESLLLDDESIQKEAHIENYKSAMKDVLGSIVSAIKEVKRVTMNLRPSMLETMGLLQTLVWFFGEYNNIYHCDVHYLFDVSESLMSGHIKMTLFRIIQEAMNNTAKHANASFVTVILKQAKNRLILRVMDDGVGFDMNISKSSHGLGLYSMKERAEASGADFSILSEEGEGVVIQVVWDTRKS